jgi:hypothetical protein
MTEHADDWVQRLHREEIERIRNEPLPMLGGPAAPSNDLPEAAPDNPFAAEWNLFRHEVVRLLREGHQGRMALVKVGQPITIWDTPRDAVQASQLLYGPAPCLVQEIQLFLRPICMGYRRLCQD